MTKPIMEVRGLGKSYVVPAPGQKWSSDFSETVVELARSAISGRLFRPRRMEKFWALKDVTFSVNPGEVLALAGHNGAGKSTLLKVLSRITSPNEGEALVRGRIGSLLEVGTGFHPDLTGRENVYLAGTILGMRHREVRSLFDEIVAFAEMESFIDMQVKRYSSGMYLRLAFSVAAHLSTELLLVDEALAVGDVAFQRKCMGKMGQIAGQGRTVLFVSHSVSAMRNLCTRGLLLDHGRVVLDGDIESVVQAYLAGGTHPAAGSVEWVNDGNSFDDPYFKPLRLRAYSEDSSADSGVFTYDTEMTIEIEAQIQEESDALLVGVTAYTPEGVVLFRSSQRDCVELADTRLASGIHTLKVRLPRYLLNEGDYRIELFACVHSQREILVPGRGNPSIPLSIEGGVGKTPYWIQRRPGFFAPELKWEVGQKVERAAHGS